MASDLDDKLDEAICASLSIRKAQPHETTEDAPNKTQWFRPNGGELWFFEFNKKTVRKALQSWLDDDEPLPSPPMWGEEFYSGKAAHEAYCKASGRNELRAELRSRLEES